MKKGMTLAGMKVSDVYEKIVDKGISASEAGILVGGWIFENFGKVKRKFKYKEEFPEVDPACGAEFVRTFMHQDWVDGEDVVQAEKTTGEDGFNDRFHRIENDIDALGIDVAKAFACLADMRKSLRALLDEIRSEINLINSDIHECCAKEETGLGKIPAYGGLIESGVFLGTSTLADKPVSLWRTAQGIMMLPAISKVGVDAAIGKRALQAGSLGRYIAETPAVRLAFKDKPVTKKEFLEKFGKESTKDGRSIREVLDILPPAARFGSLDIMVDTVAEREAAALRTTKGADAAIAAIFGLETEVETVAGASVDKAEAIPPKVRTALMRTKIDTMKKLADAKPELIIRALKREGIAVSRGEVSEWRGMAKTLVRIR